MGDSWVGAWASRIGDGDRVSGPPAWFEGSVELQALVESEATKQLAVFFEPGARTRPHVHSGDQLLICHSGEGVAAIYDEATGVDAARRIGPGDVVRIPAHTWHWHGATRSSAMCHISIQPVDAVTTWDDMEPRDWSDYREG